MSGGICDPGDVQSITNRLIAFLIGGMTAPLPAKRRGKRKQVASVV
jgi:hypothetical protein